MPLLLLATTNLHKTAEIRSILGPRFTCLTLADFPGAPAVVEDAGSFAGNAGKKAQSLAQWISESDQRGQADFVLADDSGLEVDALGGAPGVHSARFAALDTKAPGNSPDAENNAKLLRMLADLPPARRTARFRCVIALTRPQHPAEFFEGACAGMILRAPQGANGFGYDPLFVPSGFTESFAELGESVKNRISHRSQALEKLKLYFANAAMRSAAS